MDADDATGAVGLLLGWGPHDRPDPWAAVLRALAVEVEHRCHAPWSADLLRRVVAKSGELHGRDPAAWNDAVAAALAESISQSEKAISAREAEEAALVSGMRAVRAMAVAAAVLDDPRAERAARQEAHLSRELDRALAQLERLRGMRSPNRVGSGEVVSIHVGE
jgi:hypothetical protein